MGFMEELRKLTQPYDDDDNDFFEGADSAFAPAPKAEPVQSAPEVENNFPAGDDFAEEEPERRKSPRKLKKEREAAAPVKAPKVGRRGSAGDSQVILFSPKNFDEAGEISTYIMGGRSLVMTLEGIPTETARRLLDFISGIAFALNGKITPVSAKTYFVTPENVDLLDVQNQQDDYSDF